jgi:hypothetical protein
MLRSSFVPPPAFLDEHLTVALVAPLARLDDQSLHSAVEKRADHATEALGADVRVVALAVEGQRRQLTAACHCVENLPAAAVALGHEGHRRCPGRQNDRTSRRSPSTSPSATTATHTW